MKQTTVILVIVALFIVNLIQYKGCGDQPVSAPRIDTVVKYVKVHDTIKSKPKYIKGDVDTSWITLIQYVPDTNYPKLLQQYKALGGYHFKRNMYTTKFPIKYGVATVTDTVFGNELVGTNLELDVVFPEKTITIIQPAPIKRELYIGPMVTVGNKLSGNSVNIAGLYKDRKNRIFGTSVGWNGDLQIGISTYIKIK